jgi:hypothetical protein
MFRDGACKGDFAACESLALIANMIYCRSKTIIMHWYVRFYTVKSNVPYLELQEKLRLQRLYNFI